MNSVISVVAAAVSALALAASFIGPGYAGQLVMDDAARIALTPPATPSSGMPSMPAGMLGMPPVQQGNASWDARQEDVNLRNVLSRWSAQSGWTFRLEHWVPERDLPVAGTVSFPGDFQAAVRGLLSSTDLTDFPVQPCFYSNNVLRVVTRAEACDRMTASN